MRGVHHVYRLTARPWECLGMYILLPLKFGAFRLDVPSWQVEGADNESVKGKPGVCWAPQSHGPVCCSVPILDTASSRHSI